MSNCVAVLPCNELIRPLYSPEIAPRPGPCPKDGSEVAEKVMGVAPGSDATTVPLTFGDREKSICTRTGDAAASGAKLYLVPDPLLNWPLPVCWPFVTTMTPAAGFW